MAKPDDLFYRDNEMIYCFIPYPPRNKTLGWDYNKFMKLLLNDDDWACLIDHDVMFTTKCWWHQMTEVVKKYPEYSCFTALTNRIGCPWQRLVPEEDNNDVLYHREIGAKLQKESYSEVVDKSNENIPMSGFLMLVKKEAWKSCKFGDGRDGFAAVDNDFYKALQGEGLKIGVMRGIYLYHLYEK